MFLCLSTNQSRHFLMIVIFAAMKIRRQAASAPPARLEESAGRTAPSLLSSEGICWPAEFQRRRPTVALLLVTVTGPPLLASGGAAAGNVSMPACEESLTNPTSYSKPSRVPPHLLTKPVSIPTSTKVTIPSIDCFILLLQHNCAVPSSLSWFQVAACQAPLLS